MDKYKIMIQRLLEISGMLQSVEQELLRELNAPAIKKRVSKKEELVAKYDNVFALKSQRKIAKMKAQRKEVTE